MTTADTINRRRHYLWFVLFGAALLALSGCATLRRQEAASTEEVLAAAGFQMRQADTPEYVQDLAKMPPHKIVARTKNGNVVYTFADPDNCHCLYVGGPKEYSEYQRLSLDREIARENSEAAMWGPAAMDWGLRGPRWWR